MSHRRLSWCEYSSKNFFESFYYRTREKVEGCEQGRVDIDMIEANNETEWYLCGNPQILTEAIEKLKKR